MKVRTLALADQIVDTGMARANGLLSQAKLQFDYDN